MPTAHSLTISPSIQGGGDLPNPPGCRHPWMLTPWMQTPPGCRPPCGQTNTCENITFANGNDNILSDNGAHLLKTRTQKANNQLFPIFMQPCVTSQQAHSVYWSKRFAKSSSINHRKINFLFTKSWVWKLPRSSLLELQPQPKNATLMKDFKKTSIRPCS